MNSIVNLIQGKKVLVFGVGRQGGGTGDAAWLTRHGAIVRLSDQDQTICPEGQTKEQIKWADLLIKNPGVPDNHALLTYAKTLGKPVYTSIALFVKYANIKTIGITGTRGKSTTTALLTQILEVAYPNQVVSGGNIPGTSGFELFDNIENKQYAVLELSSFQLHNFHDLQISPFIAVITNLYPDHLNRYRSMDEYRFDKEAICKYQTHINQTFVNADNEGAIQIGQSSGGEVFTFSSQNVKDWTTTLRGNHNRENIAGVWAVAKSLGIGEKIARKVIQDFHTLPSRLEVVKNVGGIEYINDTTSTTPTAARYALQAMNGPTIWITGGASKNLPYNDLLTEIRQNKCLKGIIILGSKPILEYVAALQAVAGNKIISHVHTMRQAVERAHDYAQPGDTVLLSPGFTSFDLFQNEFDRGDQFNKCVNAL